MRATGCHSCTVDVKHCKYETPTTDRRLQAFTRFLGEFFFLQPHALRVLLSAEVDTAQQEAVVLAAQRPKCVGHISFASHCVEKLHARYFLAPRLHRCN